MTLKYSWQFGVRSYESDAWGFVPTSGICKYLEQTAVAAAGDTGYDDDYHTAHNSAWVVRRMTLIMHAPIPMYSHLVASTWISTMARVRCNREYLISDASSGEKLYTGVVEWVYVSRETGGPLPIPPEIGRDFAVPGHHLQTYDPPIPLAVPETGAVEFITERRAEWHEADSMGHVNNTVYPDWLDEAVFYAFESAGYNLAELRTQGMHLRGCYYNLSYKRSTLPGELVRITTRCLPARDGSIPIAQSITSEDGAEVLAASSVYAWLAK